MRKTDDFDQEFGPVAGEPPLQDAADCEVAFETSVHEAKMAGGTPGWEAYQRYGYSIWRFDGQGWQVMVSKCTEGAVCGLPPKEPGQYVGEHRKKNCEPAPVAGEVPSAVGVGVGT